MLFIFKDDKWERKVDTLSRYSVWEWEAYQCKGIFRNSICLFSIEDLPYVINLNHFFVNKLLLQFDPISYQCLEEWYLEKEASNQMVNMLFYCDRIKKYSSISKCP